MLGEIDKATGSFVGGILFLAGTSALAGTLHPDPAPLLRADVDFAPGAPAC